MHFFYKKIALGAAAFWLFSTSLFGQWEMQSDQIGASFFCSSTVYDGKMYVIGGPTTPSLGGPFDLKLYIIDLATKTVVFAPGQLSVSRSGASIAAFEGKIYLAGGSKFVGNTLIPYDVVDVFDIVSNAWTTKKLSTKRDYPIAAVVGDKILFAGGYNSNSPSDVVDIYSPASDSWETAQFSQARAEMTVQVINGKAWFCGGNAGFIPTVASSRIDIYDPSQPIGSQWTTAELSQARAQLTSTVVGDTLFVAGGYSQNASKLNRVDIIDTGTNTFSQSSLSAPRSTLAAATVGKKAYFTGGGNYNQSTYFFDVSSAVVDVFDTEKNEWSTQALTQNRMAHACAASGNKIAVAGGWRASVNSTIGTVEILEDNSVAVENPFVAESNFYAAPNPASDFLNIQTDEKGMRSAENVRVFDLTGRLVDSKKWPVGSGLLKMDCQKWPSGVFVVQVETASGELLATVRAVKTD